MRPYVEEKRQSKSVRDCTCDRGCSLDAVLFYREAAWGIWRRENRTVRARLLSEAWKLCRKLPSAHKQLDVLEHS